jgi:hypothetical protein
MLLLIVSYLLSRYDAPSTSNQDKKVKDDNKKQLSEVSDNHLGRSCNQGQGQKRSQTQAFLFLLQTLYASSIIINNYNILSFSFTICNPQLFYLFGSILIYAYGCCVSGL